ncbi:MAG: helix-turn-helix transcriptional regulator [Selenomonadaceae bacterium]|nr:helix-turn-helix transcriptional regulator [Selenomonadaceae bacterium]
MFGSKLRSLREKREIAQGEVARRLNLTNATYCRYEKDVHQPDFDTLKRIANFFEVSIDFLLDNDKIDEAQKIIDLNKFIQNGNYTIHSRFPSKKDRRLINNVINVIFEEREKEKSADR